MIGLQLKGQLGNHMFQYAAARALAERLRCRLLIAGCTTGRRSGVLGHWLLDERALYSGRQTNGLLNWAFGCGPTFLVGRLVEVIMPRLRGSAHWRTFSPQRQWIDQVQTYEIFDNAMFELGPKTWLDGWFQSEKYFAADADRIRGWFSPRRQHQREITRVMALWPSSSAEMAAIHVRRGDYADIRDSLSHGDEGWLLPLTYYRRALQLIPREAKLAVFSDDPEWAARTFAKWDPWVSRGNSAVVDMMLMAQCRWVITANSSFSWWAGWLNSRPDKTVFAPRHHLGWRIGRWVPGGIEVAGWKYLRVFE
jgi:hypothetical protein